MSEQELPFYADVTPGGAYFARCTGVPLDTDKSVYYTFRVKSLGWGYTDTTFQGRGLVPDKQYLNADLMVVHESYVPSEMKVLYKEGPYVLVSPRGSICA